MEKGQTMKTAVFAYDFPHKKTQDFIIKMHIYGIKPSMVVASPPVNLKLPKTILRDKYRSVDLMHPRELCGDLGIPYIQMPHTASGLPGLLREKGIKLGIIAGARILSGRVIESVTGGIINFHPGLIPENRGLNAVKWAVYLNLPQAVTAHFIDRRVDAGRLIRRYLVPVYPDDGIKDINARVYETQTAALVTIIRHCMSAGMDHEPIGKYGGYHPPADERIDKGVMERFEEYKRFWSYDANGRRCVCGAVLPGGDAAKVRCDSCGRGYRPAKVGRLDVLEIREVAAGQKETANR